MFLSWYLNTDPFIALKKDCTNIRKTSYVAFILMFKISRSFEKQGLNWSNNINCFNYLICLKFRSVERSKGEDLADDEEIPFYEVSAATAAMVDDAFLSIARAIRMKFDPKEGGWPFLLLLMLLFFSQTLSQKMFFSWRCVSNYSETCLQFGMLG